MTNTEEPVDRPYYDGRDGAPGKDGESAYQIAVRHGFAGTEEEWLASLQGKDGRDGWAEPPIPGPQGPQGLNGKDAYELACSDGFIGSRQEWLASLKTLGLTKTELMHAILETNTADNMHIETMLKTADKTVLGAINETGATASAGSRQALTMIQTLLKMVTNINAQLSMMNIRIKQLESTSKQK